MIFTVSVALWYEVFKLFFSVEMRLEFDWDVKLAQVKEALYLHVDPNIQICMVKWLGI